MTLHNQPNHFILSSPYAMTRFPCDQPTVHKKQVKPFLRWAGGKQWLSRHLSTLLGNCTGTYFEPFLGGASVYFSALPQNAVLSDLNARLIETYQQLKTMPDQIISLLDHWNNDEETYYEVRNLDSTDTVCRAAQFIFLNRTCWNGLYRVNRQGTFNVPFGHHGRTVFDPQHLLDASQALQNAELHHADFDEVLEQAQKADYVYLDPPYTTPLHPNGFRQYNESDFTWHDQVRLARTAESLSKRYSILAASSKYRRPTTELLIASDASLLPFIDLEIALNR